jgi:fructose-1,6-bisphosphatase II
VSTGPGPTPERNLALDLVRVTEAAALAAAPWVGRGQRDEGDRAAVEAMRLMLATVEMRGTVVIGEGAKDQAPMLYDGESVGSGRGPAVDAAVDPVEGTSLLADGRPDAISVVGLAPRGAMWSPSPAYYMNKLVTGRDAMDAISAESLRAPVATTLAAVAEAKRKPVAELTVFVLDKPRHQTLGAQIRAAGARVCWRTDGDVNGALMAATRDSGVDLLMGIGGTPEAVITACALIAMGGRMVAQLAPQRPGEHQAVLAAGLDLGRVFTERDLVRSTDVYFAATGITDGVLLPGVRYGLDGPTTASLVMQGRTNTIRTITAAHRWEQLMPMSQLEYRGVMPAVTP